MALKIVEGVESVWFYHLSESGRSGEASLCGNRRVMHTDIPVSTWGVVSSHIHERYCSECGEISGLGLKVKRGEG